MSHFNPQTCPFCKSAELAPLFTYQAPPAGEIRFDFSSSGSYQRQVRQCQGCGHCVSTHTLDMSRLYQSDYVSSTYGDCEKLHHNFRRILSLPPEKSDNSGRVQCVLDFAATHLEKHVVEKRAPTVLDIGSGLCVFLYRLKQAGWECTALDMDPRLVEHARSVAGVEAVCGDILNMPDLGRFDLITFNKVLEHVEDPVQMLSSSTAHLSPGGFVYVEVPDGELALLEGPGREEFFIEHHHIFSTASLALLALQAGLIVKTIERIHEPSTKYTLRAFLMERPFVVSVTQ